ncbi:UNKNOWN [Stylonychia lemnae]|uniref:Uncharacterized protein n=1 Tax=Stylonychia lemnae TaxID=5949 RepID=A0A078BAW9_STYLE|nr:UNKNOWN [Stylonychia lemnae]|eukprot:CDW91361.1 UNKNOWN [Stylonychia lemnae]
MKAISESHKCKLSNRFQEIDRQFVCHKTKDQRSDMGVEYEGIKLIDIYTKSNPNKVAQKYGKQLIINLLFNYENKATIKRLVKINSDYRPPQIPQEDEIEEEKLLDEQKLFQSLHEQLKELQKKYNKTTEQISELFLRVCGDLEQVEAALQGKSVPEWTYLEDLALTKPYETAEYQWLLKQKGQKEIDKRRKFLLTADADEDLGASGGNNDEKMKDEYALKDENENEESVNYI